MLMLQMDIGETTLIHTPQGDIIKVHLSAHRTSLNQPLIGFKTPDNYLIIRNQQQAKLEAFLQSVTLYEICSDQGPQALLAASAGDKALCHYRQQYPDACRIQLQKADLPLCATLYNRLAKAWLRQREGVLLVEY